MRRKIAAILAADVVGYSRLVAEDEGRALEHLLACREIFSEFVERGGGRIFNTAGDAVLAEFPSAVEALLAGIDIQDCLCTHYDAQPDGYRMQFRMGMTIGDVVERDGDLLGDGVNVAARLEGLAAPGGICISGIMHEQVLNKVSARFRDVGMKTVKNIPGPIHVYALDSGGSAGTGSETRWSGGRRAAAIVPLVGGALAILIAAVAAGAWWGNVGRAAIPPASATGDRDARAPEGPAQSSGPGVYGVVRPTMKASLPTGPRPFDPAETPFVSDGERLAIARVLGERGPHSALALSYRGAYGVASGRPTAEQAREDALNLCSGDGRDSCAIYEMDDVVTWPRPIPLPPKPWIDPSIARTPFDASRLRGLDPGQVKRAAEIYPAAHDAKALVLGPTGSWWWRSQRADESEAERVDLEQCGDREGIACRVVAIGDQFVVRDTDGPVDASVDAIDRCDRLAGAPHGIGLANGHVKLSEIDAAFAIPACRDALAAHPTDASLKLNLGRAIEKSGLFPEKALDLYREAAFSGDSAALNIFGMIYDGGVLGLQRDPAMAVIYFRRAADAGNPEGMRNLGMMYAAGIGVDHRDPDQAAQLLLRADQAAADWKPKPR